MREVSILEETEFDLSSKGFACDIDNCLSNTAIGLMGIFFE